MRQTNRGETAGMRHARTASTKTARRRGPRRRPLLRPGLLGAATALGLATGLMGAATTAAAADSGATDPAHTARAAVARAADSLTAGDPATAVEALRDATLAVWSAAAFDLIRVDHAVEAPTGFRAYTPRPDGPYVAGEPVHLYIEPIGLTHTHTDGVYRMGMTADFLVLDPAGMILGGQRGFADVPFAFHAPSTAVFMTMSLGTATLPAGEYVLQLTVHDALGDATVTHDIPVSIVAKD